MQSLAHPRTGPNRNAHKLRALRGLRLFEERGHEMVRVSSDIYLVPSSGGHPYRVDYAAETCTCPDHARRDVACKHLYTVGISRARRRGPAGEIPTPHPVRSCEGCGEQAGSISTGTGRPLMRDEQSGGFYHVSCRPGAVSFGAALRNLERMGG